MRTLKSRLDKLESRIPSTDRTEQFDRIRRWRLALLEDAATLDAVRNTAAAGNQPLARKITDDFVAKYETNHVAR